MRVPEIGDRRWYEKWQKDLMEQLRSVSDVSGAPIFEKDCK